MTFRNRQIQHPPAPKCKQCGNEPALTGRKDGFGKSCGEYKDRSGRKAKEHAEKVVG
jgi:hypothetical protein